MVALTDEEVIERSMSVPDEFGLLFDRHFDAIARFCVRRLGTVEGEDLAGDVFRWAFENRRRFDPERGAVRSWLFRIANNRVRNARRSANRQVHAYGRWRRTQANCEGADLAADAAAATDAEHDLAAVVAALERQSDEDVETLLLFAWEGLSYREIAEVLSLPIGTVRSRISRVRLRLQVVLDSQFARPTIHTALPETQHE